MPITVIDKIKQKNGLSFKLLDASDINWDITIPSENLPEDIYTKEEVDGKIASAVAESGHLKRIVIGAEGTLPDSGEDNTIYMLPDDSGSGQNVYKEYMWINAKWEEIGDSSVDLSNYATKDEVSTSNSSTLTQAKQYADTQDAAKLEEAKEYSDSQTSATLQSAKEYTDQEKAKYLPLAGGTMTGKITGIVTPTNATDAANKEYVDSVAAGVKPSDMLTPQDIVTGNTNGSISVKGTDIPVKGLGTAAFTESTSYLATSDLEWRAIS